MAKSDIEKALESARAETAWNKAQPLGGADLIPGRYQLEVDTVASGALVATDSDGGIRARIKLNVVSADDETQVGRATTKTWTLINPDGTPNDVQQGILKGDLEKMGNPAEKLSGVLACLQACLGCVVDAAVRENEGKDGNMYTNIYINGLKSPGKAAGKKKGGRR